MDPGESSAVWTSTVWDSLFSKQRLGEVRGDKENGHQCLSVAAVGDTTKKNKQKTFFFLSEKCAAFRQPERKSVDS